MPSWDDNDTTRPAVPLGVKLVVIGVLVVGAWVALSFVFAIVGRAIALVGYLVVALVAYQAGKAVGRASRDDEP
ncbi:MAG: hypothetical protein ACRDZ1_16720 [Acidimicrobiia bacterium]